MASTSNNSTGGAVAGALGIPGSLSNAASMSTPNLHGRFDPLSYGSAMLTAARDGVDRFGSPALGSSSSATPSGLVSPPSTDQKGGAGDGSGGMLAAPVSQAGGNLNENLRNIGKFFKRDMSTFGRFGGSRGGEES